MQQQPASFGLDSGGLSPAMKAARNCVKSPQKRCSQLPPRWSKRRKSTLKSQKAPKNAKTRQNHTLKKPGNILVIYISFCKQEYIEIKNREILKKTSVY
jgi:hypothetical protein